MKNKGIWALVSIVMLLGLLMGSFACAAPKPTPTPTPKVTPKRTPTSTPTPTPTPDSLHLTADGRLSFVEHRRLTFRTSGTVRQVNVSELDKVTKGQVLAKFDTTSLERAVKAAELGVKAAELALKSAEIDRKQIEDNVKAAGIDVQVADNAVKKITYPYNFSTFAFDVPQSVTFINDAKRQLEQARAGLEAGPGSDQYGQAMTQFRQALDNLAQAQDRLRRGEGTDVFASGLVSTGDFWTLRAAQLQMDKAQAAVENARTLLTKVQVALDRAKNDVDRAKNDLDRTGDELDKAVITAPFDGVIAKVNIKEGDFLSESYTNYPSIIAIEIIVPGRMELDVNVDELDILNIKLGQKATITVDVLPGKRFEGVVTSISLLPMAEANVVSYEVKIVFDVPQNLALKAGMSGWADITM